MIEVDEEEYFQTLLDNTTLMLLFEDDIFVGFDLGGRGGIFPDSAE